MTGYPSRSISRATIYLETVDYEGPSPSGGMRIMSHRKQSKTRKAYLKPAVTLITERELLELLGPAQGYGGPDATMPLDSEWVRRS